jgi:predicted nucleic acid-binding protein
LALVVDTGPLFAAYDRGDADHLRCRTLLASTDEELLVPAPVLVEFDALTNRRASQVSGASLVLLDDILAGAFRVVALSTDDYVRAHELMQRYADSDIGFVDAAVLAVVERLKEPKLATLDRKHFGLLRPRHVEALQLLPG